MHRGPAELGDEIDRFRGLVIVELDAARLELGDFGLDVGDLEMGGGLTDIRRAASNGELRSGTAAEAKVNGVSSRMGRPTCCP